MSHNRRVFPTPKTFEIIDIRFENKHEHKPNQLSRCVDECTQIENFSQKSPPVFVKRSTNPQGPSVHSGRTKANQYRVLKIWIRIFENAPKAPDGQNSNSIDRAARTLDELKLFQNASVVGSMISIRDIKLLFAEPGVIKNSALDSYRNCSTSIPKSWTILDGMYHFFKIKSGMGEVDV